MSIPRPKFCVGEVVDVCHEGSVFKGLEVVGMTYVSEGDKLSFGDISTVSMWGYYLIPDPLPSDIDPWAENLLIKRRDDHFKNIREIWTPEGEIA